MLKFFPKNMKKKNQTNLTGEADRERPSIYSCERLRITDLIVNPTLNTETVLDTDESKGTEQHLKGHFCTMVNSDKPEGSSEFILM